MCQFEQFIDKTSPGRWFQLRPTKDSEAKATGILRIRLDEASMKVRDDGAGYDEADLDWPVWAGVIPVQQVWGATQQDKLQHETYPFPKLPQCDIQTRD